MAIAIREYVGQEGFEVDWSPKSSKPINVSEGFTNEEDPIDPSSIMVDIEGIHVGPTRNFTWYTEEALKGSIPTWTRPYKRPLIMFHNEKDGKIIGRIRSVIYNDVKTKSNTGALVFTANVPDKEGKEQIQDGRLKTVSIGAIVHDARCSICGANFAEMSQDEVEQHEHQRGGVYLVNGIEKTCYWMIYKMEAKELSYVIVPSDIYAQNIRVYKPNKAHLTDTEYLKGEVLNVSEATNIDPKTGKPVVESTIIDENVEHEIEGGEKKEEVKHEDFKAKYDAEKLERERLEEENKVLKADKESTATKIADVQKELDDTKVLLDTATKNLSKAKDDLVLKEAAMIQEKSLRESLEDEKINLQTEVKESYAERVILLRESLGKSAVKKEELLAREESSLKDQLLDLKEELTNSNKIDTIQTPSNPSTIETIESSATHVKEEKTNSNMSVSEQFENLLDTLMKPKFYK